MKKIEGDWLAEQYVFLCDGFVNWDDLEILYQLADHINKFMEEP